MSEPASISMGIAERYARAVFDLSREGGDLKPLEDDVSALDAAIKVSPELRDVLISPLVSRDDQGRAIGAVAEKMGLGDVVANTLRLMAAKRRLFVVPAMVSRLQDMLSYERGEMVAEVRTATALSDPQAKSLAQALSASTGKDVRLDVTVDDTLIGGFVVKVGSQMIDTSIRAKLDALQNTMKEVR